MQGPTPHPVLYQVKQQYKRACRQVSNHTADRLMEDLRESLVAANKKIAELQVKQHSKPAQGSYSQP